MIKRDPVTNTLWRTKGGRANAQETLQFEIDINQLRED